MIKPATPPAKAVLKRSFTLLPKSHQGDPDEDRDDKSDTRAEQPVQTEEMVQPKGECDQNQDRDETQNGEASTEVLCHAVISTLSLLRPTQSARVT